MALFDPNPRYRVLVQKNHCKREEVNLMREMVAQGTLKTMNHLLNNEQSSIKYQQKAQLNEYLELSSKFDSLTSEAIIVSSKQCKLK